MLPNPGGLTGEFPLCGIVNAVAAMPLTRGRDAGGFIGLSTSDINDGNATRKTFNGRRQRWQSGAIFTFCIDCDNCTFYLRCKQSTGDFDVTWENIPSKVCVRLGLCYNDSSFEVLY